MIIIVLERGDTNPFLLKGQLPLANQLNKLSGDFIIV